MKKSKLISFFEKFLPYKNLFIIGSERILKYRIYYCQIIVTTYSCKFEIWANLGSDERCFMAKISDGKIVPTNINFFFDLKGAKNFLKRSNANDHRKKSS